MLHGVETPRFVLLCLRHTGSPWFASSLTALRTRTVCPRANPTTTGFNLWQSISSWSRKGENEKSGRDFSERGSLVRMGDVRLVESLEVVLARNRNRNRDRRGRPAPRNGEPPSPMRMKGKMNRHFVPHHLLPHPRAMMYRPSLVEMHLRLRVTQSSLASARHREKRQRTGRISEDAAATRTRVSAPPWRRSLVAFPRSDAAHEKAKAQLQPTRVGQPLSSISIPIPISIWMPLCL